ncbi:MAG: DUF2807 domain-containing protein [Alistipes sp.]|nr:DUF2807 domain-containing protein [Alistipes sp.]
MIRLILTLIAMVITCSVQAQNSTPPQAGTTEQAAVSVPRTDYLAPFEKIAISGPIVVNFCRVESPDDIKIVYDTKNNIASRFRAQIDRNGVLHLTDRFDTKQFPVTTDVTVYHTGLKSISINQATATFDSPLDSRILDLSVSGGAVVTATIHALDTFVECTGKSRLKLDGDSRYFKISVSTAKVDAFDLTTVSLDVNASHNAEVRLTVTERLEAVTSTSAKLLYKGRPEIIRNRNSMFGGDILAIE